MDEVKKAYYRNRKRIQAFTRKYKKAGYDVTHFTLPAIPKTITEASVRRLERLTAYNLKQKFISPKEQEQIARRQAEREARQERLRNTPGTKAYAAAQAENTFNPKSIEDIFKHEEERIAREREQSGRSAIEEELQALRKRVAELEAAQGKALAAEQQARLDEYIAKGDNEEVIKLAESMEPAYKKLGSKTDTGLDYAEVEYYETVIENVIAGMQEFPGHLSDAFINTLLEKVEQYGTVAIGLALQTMPYEFYEYFTVLAYDSDDAFEAYFSDLANAIPYTTKQEQIELSALFDND